MDDVKISRALLSVSDKTGLVPLGRALAAQGVELVSTGGTAKALREAGLTVRDIDDLTGFPEMMDGRVKTLHPKVHGGLLAVRDNPQHAASMAEHDIGPIDLVVVNLYPFAETVAKGAGRDEVIENIDIGGPSMVRSAAKNHAFVAIVTDPADYAIVATGTTTLEQRKIFAMKAYQATAAYDAAIAGWFAHVDQGQRFPDRVSVPMIKAAELRYGENPHQIAALYTQGPGGVNGVAQARQIQGKELSYNNYNDADAALELVSEFRDGPPTVVIVKHANPCGVATGDTLIEAYKAAFACDTVSAFGGIIAVNRPLDAATAEAISGIFTEVVAAPDADEGAKAVFASKKNLRLLLTGDLPDPARRGAGDEVDRGWIPDPVARRRHTRRAEGGDEARAHRAGTGRLPLRLDRRQACEVECDRLCQGRQHRRHRRRPDEPARIRAHRRMEGKGRRREGRLARTAHDRIGGCLRCVLPVRRRPARGGGGGRDRRDPAGRIDP